MSATLVKINYLTEISIKLELHSEQFESGFEHKTWSKVFLVFYRPIKLRPSIVVIP